MHDDQHLTHRELEVLALMTSMTDKQIAHELEISARTVNGYVDAIKLKLNAHSRTEAVALALDHGLVEMPPPRSDSH